MRYIKNYFEFINEAFDLNSFVIKEKIPQTIISESSKIIDTWYDEAGDNIPPDIKNKQDNLVLWLARNIKKSCLGLLKNHSNMIFSAYKKALGLGEDVDKIEMCAKIFDNISKGADIPKSVLDTLLVTRSSTDTTSIRDYIFSNSRNTQVWKVNFMSTYQEMLDRSEEWHDSLKASGKIRSEEGLVLKQFDDGYYWIDLLTNDSEEESAAMGHCGRTSHDTILSLRKKKNGNIEPFVTIAVDYDSDYDSDEAIENNEKPVYSIIYQCKGKNNKKPVEKYWGYIIELLLDDDLGITEMGSEYSPSEDFQVSDIKDTTILEKFLVNKPGLLFREGDVVLSNFLNDKEFVQKLYSISSEGNFSIDPNFGNTYTLWKNGCIELSEFKSKFNKITEHKNGFLWMKTNADEISELKYLYSEDDDDREHMSSYKFVESFNDGDHIDVGSSDISDILRYLDIDSTNLEKIYKYIIDNQEFEDGDGNQIELGYFIQHYKDYFKSYEIFECDVIDKIENVYRYASEGAVYSEMVDAIFSPLSSFLGIDNISLEEFPILDEYLHLTNLGDNSSHTSLDYYVNLFDEQKEQESPEALPLEINFPYNGFQGSVSDKDFNEFFGEEF